VTPTEEEQEMGRIIRNPYAADANPLVRLAVIRYRELRTSKQAAELEMEQIKEKLGAILDEHGARELTLGGVPVVRLVEYEMESVDAKALRERHPRIAKLFTRLTPVRKIEVP
jgi:hypothetical protein